MAVEYRAVGWNGAKVRYDAVALGFVVLYLILFLGVTFGRFPTVTAETALIRAFGSLAFLMLHLVILIGPLARLDSRFLPLLYNRRHLGVLTFLIALVHGVLSIVQFHAFGNVNPIVSVLIANTSLDSISHFPFQPLGFAALVILFLMAATSHDFWLANLTAPVWKTLHMLVYVAYVLLVGHVGLGILQAETHPVLAVALGGGVGIVVTLHLVASRRESAADRETEPTGEWVDAGPVDGIPDNRARVLTVAGERVAIFRYDNRLSCLSNVCRHQNGPLGEGAVVDGYVTCPWHGYQYCPRTGRSPAPFTDRVPTFQLRVDDGRVFVRAEPNPPGTEVEPVMLHDATGSEDEGDHA